MFDLGSLSFPIGDFTFALKYTGSFQCREEEWPNDSQFNGA